MAQIYRERDIRYTRERSRSSSGDERHYTTTRYKVAGGSTARVDRYDDDGDRLSLYSHSRSTHRPAAEIVEVDRRIEKTGYPDRPRSALDPPRSSDSYHGDHRTVTVEYDREVERDRDYYAPERHSRSHTLEEAREVFPHARDNYWERRRPWDDHHDHEIDVHLDKRIVRRDSDSDVKVKEKSIDIRREDRRDDRREFKERDFKIERRYVDERRPHDDEVERYRREVEYYAAPERSRTPIVIRQKMPEQKVIVNEAPRADPAVIVLREENREPRRDDDYHRRQDDKRYERDAYDEDYYYKRTVVHRDRSASSDHHKKRHIAEGALAGAGIGALVGGRRRDSEESHRGRKVLAGAALGALGTEVLRRAKSAYEDRHEEYEYDDYDQHRHRSKSRSRLATGLAIGAAALAVAGGLKYMQENKAEKEEAHRGRARRRHSDDEYDDTSSRSTSRHGRSRSKSNAAKAGAATAAIAGLVHHYRSKSRGKSRSKSRLRTGAEIAAAGLTGAAATKLWEHHKNKQNREIDVESDDEYYRRDRSVSGSRSRSRSHGRHHHPRDSAADRELGLVHVPDVEYGSEPLEPYESASEEPRRRRRKHRQRSPNGPEDEPEKKRSKSRLRDVAAAGLGTGVAAIGLKKYSDYQKSKEQSERSRRRSAEASRSRDRHDRARDRRSRDRERRQYEDAISGNLFQPQAPSSSPPLASGGFPPQSQGPPSQSTNPGGFTIHPNQATTNINLSYPPYNPQNYVNLPPPPPGPPPASASYVPPPGGPGYHRPGPENVSQVPRISVNHIHPDRSESPINWQNGIKAESSRPPTPSPSSSPHDEHHRTIANVRFRPLSPTSLETMQRHHKETTTTDVSDDGDVVDLPNRFDSSGRPLDPHLQTRHRPRSNHGEFEYRPQHPGDASMRGEWATFSVGENLDVVQFAQTIGGLLGRQRGLVGALGHMLQDRFG
ncbi:hypothetical protein F4861DRAFT_510197 [Xylaria intraflava]|nr:hypothetical protein F4861DRAFT_510197 [Xylaria intraflava]